MAVFVRITQQQQQNNQNERMKDLKKNYDEWVWTKNIKKKATETEAYTIRTIIHSHVDTSKSVHIVNDAETHLKFDINVFNF